MDAVLAHHAVEVGLTYDILRGPRWESVSHGVYAPIGSVVELAERCRAMQLALPLSAACSHYTAARLRRWWLPRLPRELPMFATVPGRGVHLARRRLYLARSDHACTGVQLLRGLRLAPATAVLGQLAEDLSAIDLIVAIDSALHAGDCTISELRNSIRPRQRGAPALRRALPYADHRSESPWETILRLLHVWSGFQVEPQYVIRDEWGDFVARADLRIVGAQRLHEYDGAGHRSPGQHLRDLRRDKELARIEWERYGYAANEIVHSPMTIVTDTECAMNLAHDPDRLKRWTAEVGRSSLSASGRQRLARRLQRFQGT